MTGLFMTVEGVGTPDKMHVIPNGISSRTFHPTGRQPLLEPKRRARLLYVGQLIELKGVDVLLRALALACFLGGAHLFRTLLLLLIFPRTERDAADGDGQHNGNEDLLWGHDGRLQVAKSCQPLFCRRYGNKVSADFMFPGA